MKTQKTLNAQNEMIQKLTALILSDDKLSAELTNRLTGRKMQYGDSSWCSIHDNVRDALALLASEVAARQPVKAEISEDRMEKVEAAAKIQTGAFNYRILNAAKETIVSFKSTNMTTAKAFAVSQGFASSQVVRVTEAMRSSERSAYACSTSSDAYWCS